MFGFDSKIRYSEVDSNGKLTLISLMDYFQDCSVFHSESLNIGVDYLADKQTAWVLSSCQIVCEKMPSLADKVHIQTWPYDAKGFYGYRNFCMVDENGNRLAYANTVWVMIDAITGRPKKIPDGTMDIYGLDPKLDMNYADRKIEVPKEYEEKGKITVPSYFIDTNQHMNNSKYIMVAKEYLPKDFEVAEMQVEYKRAALCGDVIIPRLTNVSDGIIVTLASEDGKPYAVLSFISK